MSKIDRSRGAHIRLHNSGMRVVMYPDSPGEYFDGVGKPTTAKMAQEAGFDVTLHEKQAKRLKAKRRFEDTLDIHFDEAQEALERLLEDDPDAASKLDIRQINDRFHLVDAKGNKVTDSGADFEECAIVYRSLTGHRYEGKPGDPPEAKASDAARKLAEANNIDLGSIEGTGADGAITKKDVQSAIDGSDDDSDLLGGDEEGEEAA